MQDNIFLENTEIAVRNVGEDKFVKCFEHLSLYRCVCTHILFKAKELNDSKAEEFQNR